MELRQYLRSVAAGWWIILSVLFVSMGAGLLYSYMQTPVYEATATYVAQPSQRISDIGDLVTSLDTLAGRSALVATYCNILQSRSIAERAFTALALSPATLEDYSISCVTLPDTNILRLTVTGPNPNLAADLANAVGAAGIDYVISLQEIYSLRPLDEAIPNTEQVSPIHAVNLGIGALVGLFGGLGIVLLRLILIHELRLFEPGPGRASAPEPPGMPEPAVAADGRPEPLGSD